MNKELLFKMQLYNIRELLGEETSSKSNLSGITLYYRNVKLVDAQSVCDLVNEIGNILFWQLSSGSKDHCIYMYVS